MRKKLAELMFERFGAAALNLSLAPVLSLFSTARTTGLVVNSAERTITLPVYEGHPLRHALIESHFGLNDTAGVLLRQLNLAGFSFHNAIGDLPIARDILEKICYIAPQRPEIEMDPPPIVLNASESNELQKSLLGLTGTYFSRLPHELLPDIARYAFQQDAAYTLPDGKQIRIGYPRYAAPELLFSPELIGSDSPGVHCFAYNSIWKCDADLRKQLCLNVVLAGANALYPGTDIRLRNELKEIIPSTFSANVIFSQKYSAWVGGSILASLNTFDQMCVSHEAYKEHGERILKAMFL